MTRAQRAKAALGGVGDNIGVASLVEPRQGRETAAIDQGCSRLLESTGHERLPDADDMRALVHILALAIADADAGRIGTRKAQS